MGCFFTCFSSSNNRRKQRHDDVQLPNNDQLVSNASPNPVQSSVTNLVRECPEKYASYNAAQSSVPSVQEHQEEKPVTSVTETLVIKPVQQLSSPIRKKVTFDSNVKTYEHVSPDESTDFSPETEETYEKDVETSLVKPKNSQSSSDDSSITSGSGLNHRYQNCRDSDDELDYEESDVEDIEDDGELDYDDVDEDCDDKAEIINPTGSARTARDINGFYVHSVLNPVENLTQWKVVKAKSIQQIKPQKENFNLEQDRPRISLSLKSEFEHQPKKSSPEISVDASVSNWLSSTESTPSTKTSKFVCNNTITPERTISHESISPRSFEDRPILGALTVEELKQFSAFSSPMKSPCRSPDEMPIIGTVGTYWNQAGSHSAKDSGSASSFKGIPNTTSKYREDKRVNWHSTPFETRLERALNAKACSANTVTSLVNWHSRKLM